MILPPHDRASGEVQGDWLGQDKRVPVPLRDRDEYAWEGRTPQILAPHHRSDACPDGRHLWDVIETTSSRERYSNEDEYLGTEVTFRARLTCVRCGVIQAWEGTRDGDVKNPAPVAPAPLQAGDLAAQMVHCESGWAGRDMSTWHVYRAGVRIGVITWASGIRGRAFFCGQLDEWPLGETVEAKDPAATLRKLARAVQT